MVPGTVGTYQNHYIFGGIGEMNQGGDDDYKDKTLINKGLSDMKSWAWLDFYKKHVLEGRPCPSSLPQSNICWPAAGTCDGITDMHTNISGLNYTCCDRWKAAYDAIEEVRNFESADKPLAEAWIRNRLEYMKMVHIWPTLMNCVAMFRGTQVLSGGHRKLATHNEILYPIYVVKIY